MQGVGTAQEHVFNFALYVWKPNTTIKLLPFPIDLLHEGEENTTAVIKQLRNYIAS